VTHLTTTDYIVVAEFLVALLGLIYFVVRYAATTEGEWRRSPEGRHLMFFRGSLAVFMLLAIANNIWTDYPGRDPVRIAVIGTFALAVVHGDRLMEQAQSARRRRIKARKAQDEIKR
jgi:hypothetical protein